MRHLLALLSLPAFAVAADPPAVRLNQIQVIGTHNSYHVAPAPSLFAAEKKAVAAFGDAAKGLGDIDSLAYTHAPLTEQLDRGVRSFELDVWADPDGGLFSEPLAPKLLTVPDAPKPVAMDKPGFKVFHIVDIDYISTCEPFISCLQTLKAWSDAHRDHVPISIDIELKDDPLPKPLDYTKVVKIGAAQLDALDAEIRSVFQPEQLVTPDDVRGSAATLREAVTSTGWPTLEKSRGRFLFYMDNEDSHRDVYLEGHPSLKGRVLFTSSGQGHDDAAVIKVNDPGDGSRIAALVRAGYIIRTRADADLAEAKANDPAHRTTALASGAQIVSTDFPPGEPEASNGYVVTFATPAQARCNPVATANGCTDKALEAP